MSFDLLFALWFPYHTHEHFHRASHMNSIINISQSKTIGIFHIVWRVVDTYDSLELTFIMLYCEKIHQHIHIKLKPILPTTLWPIQLLDKKNSSLMVIVQCLNFGNVKMTENALVCSKYLKRECEKKPKRESERDWARQISTENLFIHQSYGPNPSN